jgi:hypothetical protein
MVEKRAPKNVCDLNIEWSRMAYRPSTSTAKRSVGGAQ